MPYSSVPTEVRYDILEMSRFLIELSVIDYFFVAHRPSVVALASLLNALENADGASPSAFHDFEVAVEGVRGLCANCQEVRDCRDRLKLLYAQGGYESPEEVIQEDMRTDAVSPVCVSYGVNPHQPNNCVPDPLHSSTVGYQEPSKAYTFSNEGNVSHQIVPSDNIKTEQARTI